MEVIPAVDIRNGRCVRLYQGDYSQETVYADDPVAVALDWVRQGATRLHLVDLDGALVGRPVNLETVERIVRSVGVPVQLGGGIRSREVVERVLALGVGRVVLGTVAVERPALVKELSAEYGEAIVVGIDARRGKVATSGWLKDGEIGVEELVKRVLSWGVRRVVYTDISRDGTLAGPDFATLGRLVKVPGLAVIASGGVASVGHVRLLAQLGVEGVIIGRALYTGDVRLKEVIEAAGGGNAE